MLATVRTTVLPEFSVHVHPAETEPGTRHTRYVLVLQDGTAGAVELVFLTPQDLRAFLRDARDAFHAARQEARARKSKLHPRPSGLGQLTLF